jgi:hypothetical protein
MSSASRKGEYHKECALILTTTFTWFVAFSGLQKNNKKTMHFYLVVLLLTCGAAVCAFGTFLRKHSFASLPLIRDKQTCPNHNFPINHTNNIS